MTRIGSGTKITALAGVAALFMLAAACGTKSLPSSPNKAIPPTTAGGSEGSNTTTSGKGVTSTTSTPGAAKGSGAVDVLYAGSLEDVMSNTVGPAFQKATGYTFVGYSDGSSALESDIKGKIKQGDVFVSASPKADTGLEGASNGSWVSWYATFANTDLVLGYNPKSKFASQLKTKPWYQVVGQPGFKLGFTDPATDPKGMLAVNALNEAATKYNEPALAKAAKDTKDQFPETGLVGELQSGQLDAGFFYTVEATASSLHTVPLTPLKVVSPYTITVLARAPHSAGADAFVNFLLGSQGQALLTKLQLSAITPPPVSGTGVPSALDSILHVSP